MRLYDNDAYREDFMELVYDLLRDDGTNDRANQIIAAFDSVPEVEAETLQPNDPLTLEELREMDGEEIYTTKEGWIRCWGIGDGCFGPRIETGEGRGLSLLGYGDTWLAYRREPEEA